MPIFVYVPKYGYHSLIWQLYNIPLWVNTRISPKAHSNMWSPYEDPDFEDMERGTWTDFKFHVSKVTYNEWQN